MRRRDVVTLLGGAAAWPFLARAQEPRSIVGYLSGRNPPPKYIAAFIQGLRELGFLEGQNISIEYRSAEGNYNRLPLLAAELVNRGVAVMVGADAPSSYAAKRATKTTPVVFLTGADPVKSGLVDSFSRPGGNLTGVSILVSVLGPKRLEILRELVPAANTIVLLVNPSNPNVSAEAPETQAAADAFGIHLEVLSASNEGELESVFATMLQKKASALVVMPDPFLHAHPNELVSLTGRHRIPAIYPIREFVEAGGLISYGSATLELYHQVGLHTGKVLSGTKPADLPIQQSTKFELVINLKTAKRLGLTVPQSLLTRADEAIE